MLVYTIQGQYQCSVFTWPLRQIKSYMDSQRTPSSTSQYQQAMLKLQLQISLKCIGYDRPQQKPHFIVFSIEDSNNDELNFEQVFVDKEEMTISLEKLFPLNMSLIVGGGKTVISPCHLYFIKKKDKPSKMQIPLLRYAILDHYLSHQFYESIQPLRQEFSFNEGYVLYQVKIVKAEKVTQQDEIEEYQALFSKLVPAFEKQQATKDSELISHFNVKITSVIGKRSLKMPPLQSQLDLMPTKQLTLRNRASSLKKMSVKEIADKLETDQQRFISDLSPITSTLSNKVQEYEDFGNIEPEKNRLVMSSNRLLRLAIILLVIIIVAITYKVHSNKKKPKARRSQKSKKVR